MPEPVPAPSSEVRVVTEAEGLAALAPLAEDWDRLAEARPRALPHLSHAWFAAFVAHRLRPGEGWTCVVHSSRGALRGVLPLVRAPHPRLGARHPCFRAPSDDHTWAGDALLSPERPAETLRALLAALAAHEPRRFSVTLPLVRDLSPTLVALGEGVPLGPHVVSGEGRGSYAHVGGTIDAFRAHLGDQFRRNLRKAKNRLAKQPGTAFRFVPAAEATPDDLRRFLAIEASGWKAREGTAIAADPALVAFYDDLATRLASRGWLEWHVLEIDGVPAAAHMAARLSRSLVLMKIAYDERFSHLAPGNLLFDRTLERAFASGNVDEVNCLTDMTWHRNWGLLRAPYRRVEFFPRRAVALALGWAPARAKEAVRSSRPLARVARSLLGVPATPADAVPPRATADAAPREERRILCVMRWPLGGIRTYLLYTYPRLFLAGYTATFVAPAGPDFDALAKALAGAPGAEFVPAPRTGKAPLPRVVRGLLASGRFALVHSQGLGAAAQVEAARVSLALTAPRVPHVVTSHDVFPPGRAGGREEGLRRAVLARLLTRADAIVSVTEDARENLLAHLPSLRRSRARLVTIPHGVVVRAPATGGAAGTSLRARAGIPADAFVLGFFGRFMEQKGFLPLLDALQDVLAAGTPRPVRLVAVGSGDFEPEYRREVDARGLSGSVSFLPFAPEPAPLLAQVDLVVMPSLWEAAGLLAMETLVLGVPLLASDCPGLREVVRGTPALVARAGDRAAWADAIQAAIAAPPIAAAQAYAPEARKRYDAVASGEALRTLLDDTARRRHP